MQHKWKKIINNQFDSQETKGSPAEKNDLSDEVNSLTQRFKFKGNLVEVETISSHMHPLGMYRQLFYSFVTYQHKQVLG